MRRIGFALAAVPLMLLMTVGSAAADTSPNGTNFFSFASRCSTQGSRQVCSDMSLSVSSNEDGSDGPPCLEVFTYSIGANGRQSVLSDEFGCATSGTMTTALG